MSASRNPLHPRPVGPQSDLSRRPTRGRSILRRIGAFLLLVVVGVAGSALLLHTSLEHGREPPPANPQLAAVRSWGYQLQRLDLREASRSDYDLIVVDASRDGSSRRALTRNDVARLQRKPDGGRRVVLAYLSIGEAEDYRAYWRPEWVAHRPVESAASIPARGAPGEKSGASPPEAPGAPEWLGPENSVWTGNFVVRFWHPDWQRLVYGSGEAMLDRIIAAGFDGVYLDRVDAYSEWGGERPAARQDMIELIGRLATYARERRPGFLVVQQNAEELLRSRELRSVLDGVAKEDLFYGVDHTEDAHAEADVARSIRQLRQVRSEGRPVLVVEYLRDPAKVAIAARRAAEHGFILLIAPRQLNALHTEVGEPRSPGGASAPLGTR